MIPTQGLVDSGLRFPALSDTDPEKLVDESNRETSSAWWPRTITLPTYPHLILASNGYIFWQTGLKHVDPSFPGLALSVNIIYLWHEDKLPSRLLRAHPNLELRGRKAFSRGSPHGQRLLLPADEFWHEDVEIAEDADSGEEARRNLGLDLDLTNKRATAERNDDLDSIRQWIPQQSSPPPSPPLTPRLIRYRNEATSAPADREWLKWDQTWRDVAIRPSR